MRHEIERYYDPNDFTLEELFHKKAKETREQADYLLYDITHLNWMPSRNLEAYFRDFAIAVEKQYNLIREDGRFYFLDEGILVACSSSKKTIACQTGHAIVNENLTSSPMMEFEFWKITTRLKENPGPVDFHLILGAYSCNSRKRQSEN